MGKLVKQTGNADPGVITIVKNDDSFVAVSINVNILKYSDGTYGWDAIEMPEYALDNIHKADDTLKYKIYIAHIVKAYYDNNDMTGIINNYLLDPEDEIAKSDFNKMQKIRKIAKETAKEIIKNKLF